MMRIIQINISVGLVFISMLFAGTAFADNPVVNSFTASPASMPTGYTTTIFWNTASSTGRDLYFQCPQGVTIKNYSSGTNVPCNTRQSISGAAVDSAGFILTNVSGVTRNISVTLYPKDTAGNAYNQGAAFLTLSVETSQQPIIDVSASTSTVASGSPITLTWKGVDAPGVNVQFECADSVSIRTSASDTNSVLPCGRPAFSQDLSISSSLIVYPINSSRTPVSVTVRVLPDIGGNVYDATHSKTTTFNVAGAADTLSPSVSAFTSGVARVASNDSFDLVWKTLNSAGANIKFACQEGMSVFSVVSSTTKTKLPCDVPAFTPPLASYGTTTLSAVNTSSYGANLVIILLPKDATGSYFQTASQSLTIPVSPVGNTVPATTQSQAPVTPTPSTVSVPQNSITPKVTTSVTPVVKSTLPKYSFARPLKRGSKNADVTALQKFLAQHKDVYPDGWVTGYFGPATEKAVGLFQEKFGVAKKGDEGYGTVGPKTRATLNSVQ